MAERYPHKAPHECINCATAGSKCDCNAGKSHCFIRVMGNLYLSCMYCGRWERLTKAGKSRAGD